MTTDHPGEELQEEVVAWLRANGWRYRAAARHFGVPYATVQRWGKDAKAGKALPSPDERSASRARARDDAPPVVPEGGDDWDPTECTREEFLIRGVRRCLVAAKATATDYPSVSRQWETSAGAYRAELDVLREAERRRAEEAGRAETTDPSELCRRLCRTASVLATLVPEEARALHAALGRELAKTDR